MISSTDQNLDKVISGTIGGSEYAKTGEERDMYPDDRMFIQVTEQLNTDTGLFHSAENPLIPCTDGDYFLGHV